ncbi:hypothetical protein LTR15_007919 [Elasticomyces elasticus]|nr:hypothetical protein LTR15_007919 [Elasticomyces elasticus]
MPEQQSGEPQRSPRAEQSTTPKVPSPLSPRSAIARHRPGYIRVPSVSFVDEGNEMTEMDAAGEDDITEASRHAPVNGLGIALPPGTVSKARRISIQSVVQPSGIKESPEQHTPGSADPLITPSSFSGRFSGSTRYGDSPTSEFDTSYGAAKKLGKQSVSSLHSSIQPSLYAKSDAGLLSIRSRYEDWEPQHHCRTHKPTSQNWLSVGILILAIFSTVLSALFLIIALRGPRYGKMIHTNGSLTASSAAFLTSILAKLIELSFVTVLVAFLGQALGRRAFKQQAGRGVTLAELNMRSWITQPGSMLTQWHTVRYAGITLLGGLALLGALSAMLYTSAATALVQPQLKWPNWKPKVISGLVKTAFANPVYIEGNCKTPITKTLDPGYYDSTCIQMEHAAMGYHNYFSYLSTWTDMINNGTGSPDLAHRPKGYAMLFDNTTITAPWVEQTNTTALFDLHGVIINNVSMAMPHPGVIQAAIDPVNDIMQPGDLDGLGTYNIRASVPSPVVHVLCATLDETQLQPFVYELWDNATTPVDMSNLPLPLGPYDPYLGGTALDDVFGWGPAYGIGKWPPIFGRLPGGFNTMMNDTTYDAQWGRDSIYLLGKSGTSETYALCQLKASLTPNCSTSYNASSSGAMLEAVCENTDDDLAYIRSLSNATSGNYSLNKDWPNIASEWSRSLALNDGAVDANGSNSRLLTQLILATPQLNPALPSMAEALAVMAGCTLLSSATDSPFVEFWNYTLPTLNAGGQYQIFNASVRAQQYASGGTEPYQKSFFIVLFAVFGLNLVALVYFVTHREWYTDFSEPANMFSLAVNSPPSDALAGCCGGAPNGEDYKVGWKLNSESDHIYLESLEKDDENAAGSLGMKRRRLSEGFDLMMSPVRKATGRFGTGSVL